MDWWLDLGRFEHVQEGTKLSLNCDVARILIDFSLQMWVSAEEYQEDPDIIHKKFGI